MAKTDIDWEEDPLVFNFKNEIPGKTKMHTKRLDLKDWVKIDKTYIDQMKLRAELLQTEKKNIFVTRTDESAEACKWELFELLIDYLPKRFPDIFEAREGCVYNKVLDESIPTNRDDPEDPLIRAGKLTQEDWAVIEWSDEHQGYVLTSGLVYFPMRWSLQDKFNQPISNIHGPVKSFMKHLVPKVYDIFKNMPTDSPLWRANWAVFNDLNGPLDLYTPTGHESRNEINKYSYFDGENTGKELTFRAEYQTLRKLPKTKCIVFGIRTYQRNLEDFKNHSDEDCLDLIKAIETLNEDMNIYKGAIYWKEAAIKYLKYIMEQRKGNTLPNPPSQSLFKDWFWPASVIIGVIAAGAILTMKKKLN